MSPHYVCTGGCEGVSSEANTFCQAPDCNKYNKPLLECNCEDGLHAEAKAAGEAEASADTVSADEANSTTNGTSTSADEASSTANGTGDKKTEV